MPTARVTTFRFNQAIALLACLSALLVASASYGARPVKWQYSALGDSLAVGVLAVQGYVPRYQNYVQTDTGNGVSLRNLAQNGWTSTDLLTALRTDSSFRRSVRGSHVITWDIGGNDFRGARESYKAGTCGGADNELCLQETLTRFMDNWNGIISEILALRGETAGNITKTIIRTMDLYNPYVTEDKNADSDRNGTSDFAEFKEYVDLANAHIAQTATGAGIPYAQVYLAFNGATGEEDPKDKGYISADGLHPNDAGHKAMADLLRALAYGPLR